MPIPGNKGLFDAIQPGDVIYFYRKGKPSIVKGEVIQKTENGLTYRYKLDGEWHIEENESNIMPFPLFLFPTDLEMALKTVLKGKYEFRLQRSSQGLPSSYSKHLIYLKELSTGKECYEFFQFEYEFIRLLKKIGLTDYAEKYKEELLDNVSVRK